MFELAEVFKKRVHALRTTMSLHNICCLTVIMDHSSTGVLLKTVSFKSSLAVSGSQPDLMVSPFLILLLSFTMHCPPFLPSKVSRMFCLCILSWLSSFLPLLLIVPFSTSILIPYNLSHGHSSTQASLFAMIFPRAR